MLIDTRRQAIEGLARRLQPLTLRPGQRFFIDGREVYFCGLSCGLSQSEPRCRDLEVACFSTGRPRAGQTAPPAGIRVAGAVLLRPSEPGEAGPGGPGTAHETAEVLKTSGGGRLVRTGAIASYPLLVTSR